MNSSFKMEDVWSSTPFNLGTPSFIYPLRTPCEPPSKCTSKKSGIGSSPMKFPRSQWKPPGSEDGEVKIYIEPTLYVQRIVDPANKRLSPHLELLPIESHLLSVTSEAVTPELLAMEERLKKRTEQKEQEVARETSTTVEEAARKPSTAKAEVQKVGSRRRISEHESAVDSKRQKLQPSNSARHSQTHLSSARPQSTVLVRLSSGQVVRLPKSILKKVASFNDVPVATVPMSQGLRLVSKPPPTPKLQLEQKLPAGPQNRSVTASGSSKLELPLQGRLSEVLGKLASCSEDKVEKLGLGKAELQHKSILNEIMRKLTGRSTNGRSQVAMVKIRAFKGQPEKNDEVARASDEFGVGRLLEQISKLNMKLGWGESKPSRDEEEAAASVVIPPAICVSMKPTVSCVNLPSPHKPDQPALVAAMPEQSVPAESGISLKESQSSSPSNFVLQKVSLSEALKIISPYAKRSTANVIRTLPEEVEFVSNDPTVVKKTKEGNRSAANEGNCDLENGTVTGVDGEKALASATELKATVLPDRFEPRLETSNTAPQSSNDSSIKGTLKVKNESPPS